MLSHERRSPSPDINKDLQREIGVTPQKTKQTIAIAGNMVPLKTKPKTTWTNTLLNAPLYLVKEIAGAIGSFTFTTAAAYVSWNLGKHYYLNTLAKPAAVMLVSTTFPAAIVPADLIIYAITSPDVLSMAFTTLIMFNKSVPGKYYKNGKEAVKKYFEQAWEFDNKKAPKDNWSWDSVKFQVKDKVSDVLSWISGTANLFVGVVAVRGISYAALNAWNKVPILGPVTSIIADLYGAALFTAMVAIGKEAPEFIAKWGEQFAKGRVDDAVNAVSYAAETVADGAATAYEASGASSVVDALYDAKSYAYNNWLPSFNSESASTSGAPIAVGRALQNSSAMRATV